MNYYDYQKQVLYRILFWGCVVIGIALVIFGGRIS